MNTLPLDIIHFISNIMCETSIYRDKYDIAKDAASLYAASKSCEWTRLMSKEMLHTIVKVKFTSGFDHDSVYECITPQTCVRDLKETCRILNLPISGTKLTLYYRIMQRREVRIRLITVEKIIHDLEALRFKLCSIKVAKIVYNLNSEDFKKLEFAAKNRYKLREVRELSMAKRLT